MVARCDNSRMRLELRAGVAKGVPAGGSQLLGAEQGGGGLCVVVVNSASPDSSCSSSSTSAACADGSVVDRHATPWITLPSPCAQSGGYRAWQLASTSVANYGPLLLHTPIAP